MRGSWHRPPPLADGGLNSIYGDYTIRKSTSASPGCYRLALGLNPQASR